MTERSSRLICVVGAPRSGTTSLSTYLADHPDIRFSCIKEPHFFSRLDFGRCSDAMLRRRVESDYLDRYFPDWKDETRILAEGSVSYLYAPDRMAAILRLWPDARFVIAVRDPMTMLPSLHLRQLFNGDEVEPDFERAWALSSERRRGRHVPARCFEPRCLEYDQISRLGAAVERFMAMVGRDRCFVTVFDDLVADPERVYRGMLDFLGLRYHPRRDFDPRRASRGCRSARLQRLLKRPPSAVRDMLSGATMRRRSDVLAHEAGPMLGLVLRARKRILEWNSIPAEPEPISAALGARIRDELRPDVQQLARLIGRKLDHWLAPDPTVEAAPPRGHRLEILPVPQPTLDLRDCRGLAGRAGSASSPSEAGLRF